MIMEKAAVGMREESFIIIMLFVIRMWFRMSSETET